MMSRHLVKDDANQRDAPHMPQGSHKPVLGGEGPDWYLAHP
jgi:hypothetical protein